MRHTYVRAELLPTVLSVIAGSADVIGFLGLGGLFTAHITGNLAMVAAHLVVGESASLALLLSVPMFIVGLGITRVLAAGLDRAQRPSLPPLLLLQFLLLAGFALLCIAVGPRPDPNAPGAVVAGMLGVCALAVQNALVQISLPGVPPTAVLTTNMTRFTIDLVEIVVGRNPDEVLAARRRAKRTWPVVAGFTAGAALGAWGFAAAGLRALVMPAGLGLLAVILGLQPHVEHGA
ncbi:MAG TPA: YoaK family protein [Gemmatimonadales bacterium]|nr:YoaK family protein [Gemmatimonadales bacterium]